MKPILGMLLGLCLLVGCGEKPTDSPAAYSTAKSGSTSGAALPEVRYYSLPG